MHLRGDSSYIRSMRLGYFLLHVPELSLLNRWVISTLAWLVAHIPETGQYV